MPHPIPKDEEGVTKHPIDVLEGPYGQGILLPDVDDGSSAETLTSRYHDDGSFMGEIRFGPTISDETSADLKSSTDDNMPVPKDHPNSKYVHGPNPIKSYEQLINAVDMMSHNIKPPTRADKIRHVFVIGATGSVGTLIIRELLTRDRGPFVTVHCLIRANSDEAATERLSAALGPFFPDWSALQKLIATRCRVWCGDVSAHQFGLSESDYNKLVSKIDGIYNALDSHCGRGCDSKYGAVAGVKVDSWQRIVELATTAKIKHIWAISALTLHPAPLEVPGSRTTLEVQVVESQVDHPLLLSKLALSPHENEIGCRIWCSAISESFVKHLQSRKHLPVTIFRLPPLNYCADFDLFDSNDSLRRAPPIAWKILRACVQVGLLPWMPDHWMLLFTQPMDEALSSMVDLSFCHQRVHWVYNLLDPRIVQVDDLRHFVKGVLKNIGLYLRDSTWEEFSDACHGKGPQSPLFDVIADLDEIVWRLSDAKKVEFTTGHMQQDLQILHGYSEVPTWKGGRQSIIALLRSLMFDNFFLDGSLGTHMHFEPIYQECVLETGLREMGEEGPMCREGWGRFLAELRDPKANIVAPFSAYAKLARTIHVCIKTLLYMRQREKECPEILEEKIIKPLLIVGLNRAGTTFMHSLLAMDHRRNRCPVVLEMLFPYGENGDYKPVGLTNNEPSSWDQDPRRQAADDLVILQMGGAVAKKFASLHLRLSTSYDEDLAAFEHLGRSYTQCTSFFAPSHFEWLMENDAAILRSAYRHHKKLFQHLQYQRPGKRWVLKYPWHLLTVETFMENYPDSEVIFMHRGPVAAVKSFCALEALIQNNFRLNPVLHLVGPRGLELMGRMVDKAMDYQEACALKFVQEHPHLQPPMSCFMNIYFDSFIGAPLSTVHQIYAGLGWEPLTMVAEREMWDYIEKSLKYRSLMNMARMELDEMGLTKQQIRDRFQRYTRAYFDPVQKQKRLLEFKLARAIRENSLEREDFYTINGTMVETCKSWAEVSGLNPTINTCETILSYLRTRFMWVE